MVRQSNSGTSVPCCISGALQHSPSCTRLLCASVYLHAVWPIEKKINSCNEVKKKAAEKNQEKVKEKRGNRVSQLCSTIYSKNSSK